MSCKKKEFLIETVGTCNLCTIRYSGKGRKKLDTGGQTKGSILLFNQLEQSSEKVKQRERGSPAKPKLLCSDLLAKLWQGLVWFGVCQTKNLFSWALK